jgi:hypothetical protein
MGRLLSSTTLPLKEPPSLPVRLTPGAISLSSFSHFALMLSTRPTSGSRETDLL